MNSRKWLLGALALALAVLTVPSGPATGAIDVTAKIAPRVLAETAAGKTVEAMVVLQAQADLGGAKAFTARASKGRFVVDALRATADETARLIKGAKTDGLRHISYDPEGRPEVSSLVLLAALCLGRDPVTVAAEIGDGGAALLKRTVTEAVNERFAPVRARRAELAADPGYARQVLRDGCDRARAIAAATLEEVRDAMGMRY